PVTVSFDRLDDVVRLSKQILPWNPMAKSDLYKADGRYYLSIVLTDHKISMARTIFALAEYSGSPKFRAHTSPYLQEHGRRLCSGDALATLARL
ncbi:MAG: adaptor protein MecA, partial [Candidatus Weimeria sp.]|nr:adaptor protein MecA [Candidatus Weimeria sp.]